MDVFLVQHIAWQAQRTVGLVEHVLGKYILSQCVYYVQGHPICMSYQYYILTKIYTKAMPALLKDRSSIDHYSLINVTTIFYTTMHLNV